MSNSPPSISSSDYNCAPQQPFPEQRVQTIADALGVYLMTSFCDSIVRHSGKSLEELAAQSRSTAEANVPVPVNAKAASSISDDKTNRRSKPSTVNWFAEVKVQDTLVTHILG